MFAHEDGSVYDFVEKPKEPKSTLASMGIYIFSYKTLKKYLIENELDTSATKDFGKNIIPSLLEHGERVFAYRFDGYWKDVGTIDSLWDANMELLAVNVDLDLYDTSWRIYSNNDSAAPHIIGKNAKIQSSMVTNGCYIDGTVDTSVVSGGVTVEEGALVQYSVLFPGAVIKKGAVVEYAIVGENSVICENAHVGAAPETIENKDEWGVAVVGQDITVSEGASVAPKQIISESI